MKPPKFWSMRYHPLALAFIPLGLAYHYMTQWRLYKGKRLRLKVPVICVGNINIGGTGKTPTVIDIVMRLKMMGKAPGVVTRGYGGCIKQATKVDLRNHTANIVGDEPMLLANFCTVYVSPRRYKGAEMAIDDGIDVIVLDDGLQNPDLAHDLTLTVVDGEIGFQNHRVFPAGGLREKLKTGLSRSDLCMVIGEGAFINTTPVPQIRAYLAPLSTGMDWQGLRVFAFAGIGRPEKFFQTLKSLGAQVVATREFDDHQKISDKMLYRLEAQAKAFNAQLVTTEKDATRLPHGWHQKVITLPVRLEIKDDRLLCDRLHALF